VNHLLISGQYHAQNKWQLLLRIWLKKQAKIVLPNWLNELSKKNNLPFNSVRIRAQKTRWGSCSARKNINLNYQLLFLPTGLVQHILLHELCHTVHLNHSKAFWQLLTRLDPNTLHLKHQTRQPYLLNGFKFNFLY
jgi:predicted metal-dependent hydrolase